MKKPDFKSPTNAAALAFSLVFLTSGCANVHVADTAWSPNPPPPPGYTATCSSTPLPLNAFLTNCIPSQDRHISVVQAKG